MFEWRKRTRCGCGERIQLVRSGLHRFMVLDDQPHPCGSVRLWQRKDGWAARRMSGEDLARHRGPVYIEHQLTCRVSPPAGAAP